MFYSVGILTQHNVQFCIKPEATQEAMRQKMQKIWGCNQLSTWVLDLVFCILLSVSLGLVIGDVFPGITFKAKLILLSTLSAAAALEVSPILALLANCIGKAIAKYIFFPICKPQTPEVSPEVSREGSQYDFEEEFEEEPEGQFLTNEGF